MAPIQSLLCGTLSIFTLLKIAVALPQRHAANAHIKRDTAAVASSYDYVIVGGGTSGLTVADRLTEDGSKTVLVVEYGQVDNNEDVTLPYQANNLHYNNMFNITSTPQPGINNRTYTVLAGAVVGGGSAVNGMFFDRGSTDDYDAWEALGNPGWGWSDLYPYFKKSSTMNDPLASVEAQYKYQYNKADYGNGPVQSSFPPFQWPENAIEWNAWQQLDVDILTEGGANGDAVGVYWVPNTLDPKNMTRSYAKTAHYDPVANRSNYHLLVGHYAANIVFSGTTATGVQIGTVASPGSLTTVTAKKEVIIAAGPVKTPQLLKLSGVGPKAELTPLGIKSVVDLPGVGMNFQDHPAMYVIYNFNNDTTPNPNMLTNDPAYYNASYAQYIANRTGPLTVAHGNSAAFLSLHTIDNNPWSYVWQATMQNPWQYLPNAYNNDPSLLAGYIAQKLLLMKAYLSDSSAVMELPFGGGAVQAVALEKPLSRGTITINSTDPLANPVVDYGVFTNPVDGAISVAILKYVRKFMATQAMQTLGPLELAPGAAVDTDDEILGALKSSLMTPTFAHASCSCSMMPRILGGVVSPDLLVYGTEHLSIVDASIMPLIPATHLQSTVYAVAEKAADIIKARA